MRNEKLLGIKEARADWKNDSLYAGREAWSNRRWAWEFLRRNLKYQKRCDETTGYSEYYKSIFAKEFGRRNLKHYTYSYAVRDDNERCWLSETIVRLKAYEQDGDDEQIAAFNLLDGDVAMVFNLENTKNGGKAAITAQLNHAKKYLLKEWEKYERRSLEVQKPKVRRPRRDLWPLLLRLYDAKTHANASEDEIIKILYTPKMNKDKELKPFEKIAIRKKISAHLKRAKEMVETDYLSLVPLDYIQDRTE